MAPGALRRVGRAARGGPGGASRAAAAPPAGVPRGVEVDAPAGLARGKDGGTHGRQVQILGFPADGDESTRRGGGDVSDRATTTIATSRRRGGASRTPPPPSRRPRRGAFDSSVATRCRRRAWACPRLISRRRRGGGGIAKFFNPTDVGGRRQSSPGANLRILGAVSQEDRGKERPPRWTRSSRPRRRIPSGARRQRLAGRRGGARGVWCGGGGGGARGGRGEGERGGGRRRVRDVREVRRDARGGSGRAGTRGLPRGSGPVARGDVFIRRRLNVRWLLAGRGRR